MTSPLDLAPSLSSGIEAQPQRPWISSNRAPSSAIIPWGFRGDAFLLQTVHTIVQQAGIQVFVETGAFYGVTTRHMAQSYPHIVCHSCEPNRERYDGARTLTMGLSNCVITLEESPASIARLATTECVRQPTLFWLDAHGYGFQWPLRSEIEFITNHWDTAYVLIDDFRVPGRPYFDYDAYAGQECSFTFIQEAINPQRAIQLWYPQYAPHCATWSLRGWGLLVLDDRHTLRRWQPDQWLEAGQTIAPLQADREAQQAYWEQRLQDGRQSEQSAGSWELLVQQVPHWMVERVGVRMLEQSWHHPSSWQTLALRLASDMEIAAVFTLLADMPRQLADLTLATFCSALAPAGRASVLCYLHTLPHSDLRDSGLLYLRDVHA